MNRVGIKDLFESIHELGKYERTDELTDRDNLTFQIPNNPVRTSVERTAATRFERQTQFRHQLEALNLNMTIAALDDLNATWSDTGNDGADAFFGRVHVAVDALRTIFKRELESQHYLCFDPHKAKFYEKPLDGWEEIIAVLGDPSAQEITEANKCFALNRYTACVMHLCRLFEFGFKNFTVRHGIPSSGQQNKWQDTIDLLNNYKSQNPNVPDRREIDTVKSKIVIIKDMWRNPAMHSSEVMYTDEQAEELMSTIKGLMRILVTL